MEIAIAKLRRDGATQPRAEIYEDTVSEYADAMSNGSASSFPPVVAFYDGTDYWLADGFHRVCAALRIGREKIVADIQQGTRRDAQLFAAGCNATHGRPRSNAEKRRAVERLLRDDEWSQWSDREIARRCHVSPMSVGRVRSEITVTSYSDDQPPAQTERRYVDKHGNHATMRIPQRGSAPPSPSAPMPASAPAPQAKAAGVEYITLDQWAKLSSSAKQEALNEEPRGGFNRQDDTDADSMGNIEWARWSWNPVTGCKHNCPYCYARDIAERFYPQKFEPVLHPYRLNIPAASKPRGDSTAERNVFTCSMADLFGKWVPREWIEAVLRACVNAPEWNFLFLTKFPSRLTEFDFPDNAWVGTSVDCQARVDAAEKAFRKVRAKFKWLSCEPLIEPLKFSSLEMFDWIVIGGASRSTATPEYTPPAEWLGALFMEAARCGLGVYLKTNGRPREYPGRGAQTAPAELQYLPSKVA